jgi:hypothetical protein
VVEIVSRGNKDSRSRADLFRVKLLECLMAGVHLLVVDVHPPTRPAPGFASVLARRIGDKSGRVAPGGRTATSFEVEQEPLAVRIYHEPLVLGTTLPDMPLFLLEGRHVQVPLEATYRETIPGLPADVRALLE